jgi:diguanylate cyclase (GGDEF)-like protein
MCWLVQRLLKPLARATSRISKMDSDGEQQLVLPVESDDEVGKLVKTFNKLHQSLHLSRLELQNQAHTDFLTGLANRRHFLELAELEVTRSIRYGSPLAAFMLDIDLFKKVNDTYGHKVGDLVLKRLSGIVLEALREVDVAGRFGGEEFAILLPETDGKQAVEVAERLRQLVESTPVILENGLPLKFTVSIGISSFAGKETNIDTLLNLADQALYKAKNSGRNKVVMEGQ